MINNQYFEAMNIIQEHTKLSVYLPIYLLYSILEIPVLQSLADVKTRVMDMTMYHISKLAHYLGYGWCAGCRGEWVGEDFRRKGDSWEADKQSSLVSCSGYKSSHRLKINYGDFKFSIKDMKYGTRVIQSLQPEVYDEGTVTNQLPTSVKHWLEREVRSVRTVTHTATSAWKHAHEVNVEFKYTPPPTGGAGGGISYTFSYESQKTTTDSTSNEQSNKFRLRSEATLDPNSAAEWKIMMSKTRYAHARTCFDEGKKPKMLNFIR